MVVRCHCKDTKLLIKIAWIFGSNPSFLLYVRFFFKIFFLVSFSKFNLKKIFLKRLQISQSNYASAHKAKQKTIKIMINLTKALISSTLNFKLFFRISLSEINFSVSIVWWLIFGYRKSGWFGPNFDFDARLRRYSVLYITAIGAILLILI
jgi:hypothetical protein